MRRRSRLISVGLSGVISVGGMAAVLFAGASSGSDVQTVSGASSSPSSRNVRAPQSSTTVEELVEGIAISPEIHSAQEEAIRACMKGAGFRYDPVPY